VLVTRQPLSPSRPHGPGGQDPDGHAGTLDDCCGPDRPGGHGHPNHHPRGPGDPGGPGNPGGPGDPGRQHAPDGDPGLTQRLQAAMALLPPILGGAPSQPLDLGRTTRVVTPTQRTALAVRDGGWVVPGCARPLAWGEAHHLVPWLDGGPTDLENLALVCRAQHRAVHEGGWQLQRQPDGRLTAAPSRRRPRRPPDPHRRHHTAA
jgi:HNH endonuclease